MSDQADTSRTRKNASILLRKMRGLSKGERKLFADDVRAGPFLAPLYAVLRALATTPKES